ncbi:hypothetical protein GCM10009600_36930 [Oerskovia paurometabola]
MGRGLRHGERRGTRHGGVPVLDLQVVGGRASFASGRGELSRAKLGLTLTPRGGRRRAVRALLDRCGRFHLT